MICCAHLERCLQVQRLDCQRHCAEAPWSSLGNTVRRVNDEAHDCLIDDQSLVLRFSPPSMRVIYDGLFNGCVIHKNSNRF